MRVLAIFLVSLLVILHVSSPTAAIPRCVEVVRDLLSPSKVWMLIRKNPSHEQKSARKAVSEPLPTRPLLSGVYALLHQIHHPRLTPEFLTIPYPQTGQEMIRYHDTLDNLPTQAFVELTTLEQRLHQRPQLTPDEAFALDLIHEAQRTMENFQLLQRNLKAAVAAADIPAIKKAVQSLSASSHPLETAWALGDLSRLLLTSLSPEETGLETQLVIQPLTLAAIHRLVGTLATYEPLFSPLFQELGTQDSSVIVIEQITKGVTKKLMSPHRNKNPFDFVSGIQVGLQLSEMNHAMTSTFRAFAAYAQQLKTSNHSASGPNERDDIHQWKVLVDQASNLAEAHELLFLLKNPPLVSSALLTASEALSLKTKSGSYPAIEEFQIGLLLFGLSSPTSPKKSVD